MFKDALLYLKEFCIQFKETGSIFPSSKFAAKVLTDPIRNSVGTRRILEVGPGAGCVTVKILQDMLDTDTLCICEINPRFMKALKKKIHNDPNFIRHKSRISFFEGPVQKLPEPATFDMIVCALPFTNFDLKTVQEIFAKFKRISTSETLMTYYEYIGLRSIGMVVSDKDNKERLEQVEGFFESMYKKNPPKKERVWLNVTPSNIYTLRVA